jgi:hypothetical protein
MKTNNKLIDKIRSRIYKAVRGLVILSCILVVIGCINNTVAAGKDGIDIVGGQWTGSSENGSFSMEFNIGTDGANIFILTYSYPCDDKVSYVFPPKPIKALMNNSTFETTIEGSDLSSKLVITGRFIDSTHAEGAWESSGYQNIYLEMGCQAASGTWKSSPAK